MHRRLTVVWLIAAVAVAGCSRDGDSRSSARSRAGSTTIDTAASSEGDQSDTRGERPKTSIGLKPSQLQARWNTAVDQAGGMPKIFGHLRMNAIEDSGESVSAALPDEVTVSGALLPSGVLSELTVRVPAAVSAAANRGTVNRAALPRIVIGATLPSRLSARSAEVVDFANQIAIEGPSSSDDTTASVVAEGLRYSLANDQGVWVITVRKA